jgi:adenosylcobyric acid synthase
VYKAGKTVIGICGGYQMLGEMIEDPLHVEGEIEQIPGLGILPVTTILQGEKTTLQRQFKFRESTENCTGYEIHMGESYFTKEQSPVAIMSDGRKDGYYESNKVWGSYLHGILDNGAVIEDLLAPYAAGISAKPFDFQSFKERQYDKLADLIRENIDMELIYKSLHY